MSRPTDQEIRDRADLFREAAIALAGRLGTHNPLAHQYAAASVALRYSLGEASEKEQRNLQHMVDQIPPVVQRMAKAGKN